ncbi:hypothetical protein GFS31_13980 [Leptolyngbya sp. BL0902]|nr:hypothetical protein GFS31_13980 [Leptolyngbya sp. BL0902]
MQGKYSVYPQGVIHSPYYVIALTISIIPLGLIVIFNRLKDIPVQHFMADPVAVMGQPFYLGFLSQLGIFIWSAMASVCLLTAQTLPRRPGLYPIRQFFLGSGILSLVLGFDDVFLLHEEVFPAYLGIPEMMVYALYAGLTLAYLWQFRKIIRRTDYTLLVVAFVGFALSIGLDILEPPYINPYFFEDGFKFIGLVAWSVYFWQAATSFLRHHTEGVLPAGDDSLR